MKPTVSRALCLPLVFASGCYYYGESVDQWSDLDSIITAREPGREFDGMQTYAMPESVADLSEFVDDPEPLTDAYDQDYIDRVAENMADYGWTRVDDIADADVLILNGKVASEYWVSYTYWWGYYPYYIYYPYYPTQTVSWSFPVGSIVTLMIKPDELTNIDDLESVPAIWVATALGAVTDTNTKQRIESAVDQAFAQSDYLMVGDATDPIYDLDAPLP